MSDVAEWIAETVRLGLAPELKRRGYKGTRKDFRRVSGDAVLIVAVQSSMLNGGREGRFTLNLGIHFPDVHEIFFGERMTAARATPTSPFFDRIGGLMPDGKDLWWTVGPHVDRAGLARTVADTFVASGEPWLTTHADLRVARDRWPGFQEFRAAASIVLGERDVAARFAAEALRAIRADARLDEEERERQENELRAWTRRAQLVV